MDFGLHWACAMTITVIIVRFIVFTSLTLIVLFRPICFYALYLL